MTNTPSHDHYPEEKAVGHGARGAAVALLIAAAVVVAANVAGGVLLERSVNRGYALLQGKWRLLERVEEPVDYLVVGDSSCNQGVDPMLLGERLGGTVLNLCTIADALTVNSAWLVGAYIERFGPPKAVIVVHTYDIWARDDRVLREALLWNIDRASSRWRRQAPALTLRRGDEINIAFAPHLPLYYQNKSIWYALRNRSTALVLSESGYEERKQAAPERVQRDLAEHLAVLRNEAFHVSEANRAGLKALLSLADRHEFRLWWAHSPVVAELAQTDAYQARMAAINALLDAAFASSLHAKRVFDSGVQESAARMENVDHVTDEGAQDYTTKLAEALAAH